MPSKVLFSVAVIFVFLSGLAIWAVFLRPIPEQAAFGRYYKKGVQTGRNLSGSTRLVLTGGFELPRRSP